MARKKVVLKTTKMISPKASILVMAGPVLFQGDGNIDHHCGSCDAIINNGVDDALGERFAAPVQLLAKCFKCGEHNVLPGKLGN